MVKLHVIYIPGIGDNLWHVQGAAVSLWRFHGVKAEFHEFPWLGEEPFGPKFERLLNLIDRLEAEGHNVSLVGASAGASAVLNAYAARRNKIKSVALVCPKIKHPETVARKTYTKNPAFEESMERLQDNLPGLNAVDKAKMRIYYSPVDRTVPFADSSLEGVEEQRLPRLKHSYAIVYAITLGAPGLLRHLKQPF